MHELLTLPEFLLWRFSGGAGAASLSAGLGGDFSKEVLKEAGSSLRSAIFVELAFRIDTISAKRKFE